MSILSRFVRPKQPTRAELIAAAQDRLVILMADFRAKVDAANSDRTRRGNLTRAAQRRAGA